MKRNVRALAGTLAVAVLAATLSGCLFDGGGSLTRTAQLQIIRNLNDAQRAAWNRNAPSSYKYTLEYNTGFLDADHYKGSCQLSADTNNCALTAPTDDDYVHLNTSPAIPQYFGQVDSLITFMDTIFADTARMRELSTTILRDSFQSNDTSATYVLTIRSRANDIDTVLETLPVGLSVKYNRQFGFPESLSAIPFGPSYFISGFSPLGK